MSDLCRHAPAYALLTPLLRVAVAVGFRVLWFRSADSPPVELTAAPIGDGTSFYIPYFCAETGLDADRLWEQFQDRALYTPRSDRTAKYRGNELNRSKFYVNFATGGTAKYGFPGFQWAAMPKYKRFDDPAYNFVTSLKDQLQTSLRLTNHDAPPRFTQAIATMYENGTDGIGWHNDKVHDIEEGSIIFDISLGGERTFSIGRANGKGAPTNVEEVLMRHGSAILLSTQTNRDFKHAVLPVPGAAAPAPRVSLVLRDISTVISDEKLRGELGARGVSYVGTWLAPPATAGPGAGG